MAKLTLQTGVGERGGREAHWYVRIERGGPKMC